MYRQNIHNQQNIKGEEQSYTTDTTQLEGFLQSYRNQDSRVLVKK